MRKLIGIALFCTLLTAPIKADLVVLDENKLLATVDNSGSITQYEYDSIGNITREGLTKFEYTDEGQLKRRVDGSVNTEYQYDSFGRLTANGNAVISYDSQNSMMNLYKTLSLETTYGYDSKSGIRTSKTINGKTINFVLDDSDRVIEERDSDGNTISRIIWSEELPSSYIYKDKVYQYVCNSHGDVVALLDEAGTKVNTYKYDIWGQLIESNETIPNAIRYNHEYYDEESGFYYLRGRYYDPSVRRFTTPDPAEDGINWYAYCGNNPLDYIDPSGYAHFRKVEQSGHTLFITEYYSREDLKGLLSIPTLNKTIKLDIWDAIVALFAKRSGFGKLAAMTYTSLKVGAGLLDSHINDLASQAYAQKGALILNSVVTVDPDNQTISTLNSKIISNKDAIEYDSGKRKI